MQIFTSSTYCYQPVIVIKKGESQSDHNKRLPLYIEGVLEYVDYICLVLSGGQ
jgi:hypothetical protein